MGEPPASPAPTDHMLAALEGSQQNDVDWFIYLFIFNASVAERGLSASLGLRRAGCRQPEFRQSRSPKARGAPRSPRPPPGPPVPPGAAVRGPRARRGGAATPLPLARGPGGGRAGFSGPRRGESPLGDGAGARVMSGANGEHEADGNGRGNGRRAPPRSRLRPRRR